jgi:DNA polymerase-1
MDKIFYRVYPKLLLAVFKMEERGVSVDVSRLKKMEKDMQKDLDALEYQLLELAGLELSLTSGQQLQELLYGWKESKNPNLNILRYSFGFPVEEWTSGGKKGIQTPSTGVGAITKLSKKRYSTKRKQEGVEFCRILLEYKKLKKLMDAFVSGMFDKLYDDGKVHPNFNVVGTDSGRFSCSEPNLQQLPKAEEEDKYQIRSLFIGDIDPKTGKRKKIIAADYKNLEMMVLTHFSQDKLLIKMFAEGGDTHGTTAVNMFGLDCKPDEVKKLFPHLRQAAKIINFMLMYGGGAKALFEGLIDSGLDLGEDQYLKEYKCTKGIEVAQKYIDKYFEAYFGVAQFLKGQVKFAHRNGYTLTIIGRKRRLENINSNNFKMSSYEERLAKNAPIQGSAGDITEAAQNRLEASEELRELGCEMLLQVHDELVFQCPEENVEEAIPIIKNIMEHPFGEKVKLNIDLVAETDFGDSYQEAK